MDAKNASMHIYFNHNSEFSLVHTVFDSSVCVLATNEVSNSSSADGLWDLSLRENNISSDLKFPNSYFDYFN